MAGFDQRDFRSALGRFATGVTIITARGGDGRAVGVTANSFNSVSLDPPLVLWSLDRKSGSLDAFESADEFAIHVLGLDQEHLSNRFASRGADKFEGLAIGDTGVPLLEGSAARFHCRKVQRHDVGDHILYIGEVIAFHASDDAPLLYLQGRYGEARRREVAELSYDLEAARLGKGAILNLLSDAYVRIIARFHAEFGALGLSQSAPVVLIALSEGVIALDEITRAVEARAYRFSAEEQQAMVRQGLIAIADGRVTLLPEGKTAYARMLAAMKRVEDHLIGGLTAGEVAEARHFLAKLGNLAED
ncbi:MAG: flavin reductase [Proteobacteria bacterium]|nr:flavin reductase [Pseudomonadota bacterium]